MSAPEGSTVAFKRVPAAFRRGPIQRFARTLQKEVAKGRPFDCLITGDAELRRLNLAFRGKDYATDVLSFPADAAFAEPNGASLGDIAISLPRARAQARQYGHEVESEVRILMLHGMLHLVGMDHESDNGRMARIEKRWRKRLNLPDGLIERAEA